MGAALTTSGGYSVSYVSHRDALETAATDSDVLLIATPDHAIAEIAAAVQPNEDCVVAHLAGSIGLEPVRHHPRHGALHPLVSLPSAELGAPRLRGAWFAVAGDPAVAELAGSLDGRTFEVADENRTLYHAAAAVAANHLVAVVRDRSSALAARAEVPFEAFLPLAEGALASVGAVGPAKALTGPAARGDEETIAAHLEALPEDARDGYLAMLSEARRLVT